MLYTDSQISDILDTYKKNKERMLLASSEYYKNMDEDKKKASYKKQQIHKITCDCCGIEMLRRNIHRHVKTKTHLQNVKNISF